MNSDILIHKTGAVGQITLNRPNAMNALSHAMIRTMAAALETWAQDDDIRLVLLSANSARAFCAGGDIRALYQSAKSRPEIGRAFWFDEYRLNNQMADFAKPIVVLMDGIVMGGGVGISAHASHRIVTERSRIALPEVGIGFIPDVGSTRLLADAPGYLGRFIGMTAQQMTAADAIYAGFADRFVPSQQIAALTLALCAAGDIGPIAAFATLPPVSQLAQQQAQIDQAFGQQTAAEICAALARDPGDWARSCLGALRAASPTAVVAALHAINHARGLRGLAACFALEYRFAYRSLDLPDFIEGIRAAVIDKDRSPNWQPSRIEDVSSAVINDMFATLGPEEWSA